MGYPEDWWYSKYNIYEMTATELSEYLKKVDIILIPIGSCEQHGTHGLLSTDGSAAWIVTKLAAEKVKVPHTPLIWMGYSPHHMKPGGGTITLRESTFRDLLYDVGRSLIHHGFNKLVFVTGHTSNIKVTDPVIRQLRYETNALAFIFRADAEALPSIPEVRDIIERPLDENPGWHAGEIETSLNLLQNANAVLPYLKNEPKWSKSEIHAPKWLPQDVFKKKDGDPYVIFKKYERLIMAPMEHSEYADRGVVGNPEGASAEKAEKIYKCVANILADFLEELKKIKVEVKVREFTNRV
jgi:creatinine amidohydrolase